METKMLSNSGQFDADKFLTERGWTRAVAGDSDFDLGCRIVNAVRNSDKGLILSGTFGVGKTSFVKAAFGVPCFTMPDDEWILGKSQDAIDISADSIFLDDVGSEHTAFDKGSKVELFSDFIMRRYELFKKTQIAGFKPHRLFITTNLGIENFDTRYGTRAVSRLKEMCFSAHFEGKDKRKWEKIK